MNTTARQEKFYPTDRLSIEWDNENPMRVIFDIFKLTPENTKQPYGTSYFAASGFYQELPGVVFHQGLLRAPINLQTYRAIQQWPDEYLIWQSPKIKERFEGLVEEEKRLAVKAKIQTDWRAGVPVPPLPFVDTAKPLKPHQQVAAFLGSDVEENDGFGLLMEQGTGKTPTAISIICDRVKKERELNPNRSPVRALIIVPPALKLNWKPELDDFTVLKGYHYVLEGTANDRIVNLMSALSESNAQGCDYLAVIVSYDTLVNSQHVLTRVEWDLAITDESQLFKDPKSKRWKCLEKVRDVCKRRYILTGTPVGNHSADLYTQLEFLKQGASTCSSYKEFKNNFSVTVDIGSGLDKIIGSSNNNALKEIIARRTFVCRKAEVLKDLPEKIFELVSVNMGVEQTQHYKALARDLVAEIESDMGKDTVSINHILTQLLRLAQVTAGYLTIDEVFDDITGEIIRPKEIRLYKENKRIDTLIEFAKELPANEKMIIWNHWNPLIDPIFERFHKEGFGDQICVYRGQGKYSHPLYQNEQGDDVVNKHTGAFNARRNCRFLLANPASANMGLTLIGYPPEKADEYDTNCTEMIYFSYDWSYLKRAQSEDRAHRIGCRAQLRIRDLLVEKTIDQEILTAVKAKKDLAEDIADVRNVLKALAGLKL